MYEKFLPKFKVVELNLSTAHLIGHVIAQTPAYTKENADLGIAATDLIASTDKNGYTFIENGVIVGVDAKGNLSNYDATKHSQPCLVYNDELVTGPFDNLDQYAHFVDADPAYVRALPLYLIDAFTTNNYAGESGSYAKVVDGVLTLEGAATADTLFLAKKTTLPNREPAYEFTYVGKIVNE